MSHASSVLSKGTKVYYITGNHDEMLRKFEGFRLGNFEIVNKLLLDLDGKKAWFFHGDVFDITMKHSKWLAKLGSVGYDTLIAINTLVNWVSKGLGKGKISLSKRIKNSVKGAVSHINDFEQTAAEIAIDNEYDYVICGHIHQPEIRENYNDRHESVKYLNSGDWIENLTALEYNKEKWTIYDYFQDEVAQNICSKESKNDIHGLERADSNNKQLFQQLVDEFHFFQFNNKRTKK